VFNAPRKRRNFKSGSVRRHSFRNQATKSWHADTLHDSDHDAHLEELAFQVIPPQITTKYEFARRSNCIDTCCAVARGAVGVQPVINVSSTWRKRNTKCRLAARAFANAARKVGNRLIRGIQDGHAESADPPLGSEQLDAATSRSNTRATSSTHGQEPWRGPLLWCRSSVPVKREACSPVCVPFHPI
jgi:hypothetical protein